MIYVLLLEKRKIYVGYTARPVGDRFIEHFNYSGSRWTTLYRPLQVLEVHEGEMQEENEMTLKMMDKYGWWNVRGGSWCQVDIKSCPPALLEWQDLKLPKTLKRNQNSISKPDNPTLQPENLSKKLKTGKANTKAKCTRCGRSSHSVDNCFAETHANGDQLEVVNYISLSDSADSVSNSELESELELVTFDENACFRCGRMSHFIKDCYAKKDIHGNPLN
ncbi:hypothetical protein HDV06_006774 [Boothiomyces sp. JEL0866]|nr:hypothetical protein HDV06_006774 [Boothiomyces sp. JEL0866]